MVAVRILDRQTPQPAECFKPDAFLQWIQKLLSQAERVYRFKGSSLPLILVSKTIF